jgi:hypothetical protein
MTGQIAQLARFIDQTGLFLANGSVTNELHFLLLPGVVWLLGCFMEQRGVKFNG